jgi:type II restriction/modification system DNA methylase subunit YeeA
MPQPSMTPQAFITKWEQNAQKESASAKEHFANLCQVLGEFTPNDPGSGPDIYCFEKSLTKTGGKAGFADVWKRDCFAWEYKGKGKFTTLDAAYAQLLLYKEDLGNPPILVVCDIATYEVHIAFTGYPTKIHRFTNSDIANASTRELLKQIFTNPELLRPVERQATITEQAAARLARVAQFLEKRGFAPSQIAPFFMKVLFALFAEDIKLLPAELMSQGIKQAIFRPNEFVPRTQALFRAMHEGGYFGQGDRVPQFNGWLFVDTSVLPLNANELQFLAEAAKLDWSQVEPAIFGTLFERSLDPSKRAQLGAHYTSRDDILLIVEPVLMAPLRREWERVKAEVEALRAQWEPLAGNARRRLMGTADGMLLDFLEKLANVRVLDAACGSGNFLYVALNELKNLEKEVWTYAGGIGLTQPELGVSPAQLFGIEKNQFAAELAQVVVWIGYLQWKRTNGFFDVEEPILKELHNIECRDAILTVDLQGQPAEPEWPEADVIIGNPPFLGDKKMRGELGDIYVETLRQLYKGRVPGGADLVTYWFERAGAQLTHRKAQRAGLLATQGIRGIANRIVLERIKQTGDIFWAWSDRPWVLDGAAVRVAMIGFDNGSETLKELNGQAVASITADLKSAVDVTDIRRLAENAKIAFLGSQKAGPFDIDNALAQQMLSTMNASGRSNADVVRHSINGLDVMSRPRNMWIIDFGTTMLEAEASLYEKPYAYVKENVYPIRAENRRSTYATFWWRHAEPRPGMRSALQHLKRYIVTPEVAKHRVFVWMDHNGLPDHRLHVFARDDNYFFGVLHSHAHNLWMLATSIPMGDGKEGGRPTYKNTETFETFPFPWPPGKEPKDDPRVQSIAAAARELVRLRDAWLGGTGAPDLPPDKRTLTNLYNRRPDWLDLAHKQLDATVLDAYGWPHDISDDDILARLLALNLERAAAQGGAVVAAAPAESDADEGD